MGVRTDTEAVTRARQTHVQSFGMKVTLRCLRSFGRKRPAASETELCGNGTPLTGTRRAGSGVVDMISGGGVGSSVSPYAPPDGPAWSMSAASSWTR